MERPPQDPLASPWEQRRQRLQQQSAQRQPLTLQEQIDQAVWQGFRVLSQTETTAQLIKPKSFSFGWMLVWTLLSLGTLFWVYPVYYLSKKDQQLYLQSRPPG